MEDSVWMTNNEMTTTQRSYRIVSDTLVATGLNDRHPIYPITIGENYKALRTPLLANTFTGVCLLDLLSGLFSGYYSIN